MSLGVGVDVDIPPWCWQTFHQLSPSAPEVPASLDIEWDLGLKLSPKSRPKSLVSLQCQQDPAPASPTPPRGMCCCHEEAGDVAGPSFTAAAFSSFPYAAGDAAWSQTVQSFSIASRIKFSGLDLD